MTFDAGQVCNNVLMRAFRDDFSVSPMKLQKILYFVASEYAKDTGEPLLSEPFQPWQYGPVVQSVYSEFKPFGGGPIRRYAKDSQGKAYIVAEDQNVKLRKVLDRVWPAVKSRSAVDLSRITHLPGSAWRKAFDNSDRYIRDADIESDTSYRSRLGLD
ncbi:Panacea domain-containing protein [Mycolicibacterium austroafricanum]|uniref:Panacea domain-containing protein n=1 Tax=Mycolicibacterium austroafricanum TaxID=39687 RepID=UPI000CF9B1E4|nr:type II toxin-antitoxin system antitoxin SocA domain-containing protein [Mycolicibacterium austroafricanum]PQP39351.1 hypothetical protein C6A88_33470 [Mycolicibacterium austroafricanum]